MFLFLWFWKKLKKEILQLDKKLRLSFNMVIYHTLLHHINIVVKSRLKAISKRHAKKLAKFYNRQSKAERQESKRIPENIADDSHCMHHPMLNWLLYLMVWIIKFQQVKTGTIRQLKLSIFFRIYLMTYHIYL